MSRHTLLDKELSRLVLPSLPEYDNHDLIVYLEPGAKARIVAEPNDRRLKRNEELPTVSIDLHETFKNGLTKEEKVLTGMDAHVSNILNKVAIASNGEDTKEYYHAKVMLLTAIAEEFNPPSNTFED